MSTKIRVDRTGGDVEIGISIRVPSELAKRHDVALWIRDAQSGRFSIYTRMIMLAQLCDALAVAEAEADGE